MTGDCVELEGASIIRVDASTRRAGTAIELQDAAIGRAGTATDLQGASIELQEAAIGNERPSIGLPCPALRRTSVPRPAPVRTFGAISLAEQGTARVNRW
jgi:hypothetical protein